MSALIYFARRFVAGENMEQALTAVRALNAKGLLATLDILGENVTNREKAEKAVLDYVRLLEAIAAHGIQSHVSLKLTQMGLNISEEFCLANVRAIVEKAKSVNNFVRIDMEDSQYTEKTLRVFKYFFREFSNVGIVLQAYLHRSEEDVRVLARMKAPVRICKGAYREPSTVAYKKMDTIRDHFKKACQIMWKADTRVAVATHDEKLISWVLNWTREHEISKQLFEFQILYGLRRRRAKRLADEGYAVRSYVPYGTHWLPYLYRRLRERKENIFAVIKGLVRD